MLSKIQRVRAHTQKHTHTRAHALSLSIAGEAGGASLLRCAALAAQATKYPELNVSSVIAAVDEIAEEVGPTWQKIILP